ncbi:MAG: cytochrome c [Nitrospira sp. SB0677_bin_15]|nr:cytochrome c [Nitrospira sp. SB0677_bin_15]
MEKDTCQKVMGLVAVVALGWTLSACGEAKPPAPPPPAPPEYADKHMPDGYWNNPEIIEQGKAIFTGAENIDVNCASCHGKDGKPVKAGARDFRKGDFMKLFSDSQWFWRVSEGVKGTKMKAWKSKLSEDDRWKVIAFEATFGLKGMEYSVAQKKWVPQGTVAPAAPATEEAAPASEEAVAPNGEAAAPAAEEAAAPNGEAAAGGESGSPE